MWDLGRWSKLKEIRQWSDRWGLLENAIGRRSQVRSRHLTRPNQLKYSERIKPRSAFGSYLGSGKNQRAGVDLEEAREATSTAAVPGTRVFCSLSWYYTHLSMCADTSVGSGESEPGIVFTAEAEKSGHRWERKWIFDQLCGLTVWNVRTHHLSVTYLLERHLSVGETACMALESGQRWVCIPVLPPTSYLMLS